MFIPCNLNFKNLGISCIRKNNKISLAIARRNEDNAVELIDEVDSEFPFSNPLITNSSVKMFEFIIETNNLQKRLLERRSRKVV